MPKLDLAIRGGPIVTASDIYKADIGTAGDKISVIAQSVPRAI